MKTENTELMTASREALQGKWALAIGGYLIYMAISATAGSLGFPGSFLSLIISGPFALGVAMFSLSLSRGEEARVEQIFDGFKRFTVALVAYLLMLLFILMWTLLLIVPGIMAALSYSMTFYILADDPALAAEEALKKSKSMMEGYKMKLFHLCLRFFVLALLCILTLGIGFFWLIPYANVTMAKFYEDIKLNPAA